MRWLFAAGIGALGGVTYLRLFLSDARVEPLAVFAVIGVFATGVDALVSRYFPRHATDAPQRVPRGAARAFLRSAGVFAIAFLAGLIVSVAFVAQMAP